MSASDVEITVDEVLLGTLPKDAPEQVMLEVSSIDELPGSLKGETMLLFLRWDLESDPPYHHHLMPADEEVVVSQPNAARFRSWLEGG